MLRTGDSVPLMLQLFDGSETQKVKAAVIDPSGAVIFEGPLVHVFGGMYQTLVFQMPEVDFIVGLYQVEDSDEYTRSSDTFYRSTQAEITRAALDENDNKYDNYIHGVVTDEGSDGFMEGVIDGTVEAQAS